MGWTGVFIEALKQVGRAQENGMIFILRSFRMKTYNLHGSSGKGQLLLSNARGLGPNYETVISKVTIDGPRVALRTWSSTIGQATIEVSTARWAKWGKYCRNGDAVELLVGFRGWDVDEFQVVFFGIIRNVDRVRAGVANIQILGPEGLLSTRLDVRSDYHAYFGGAASSATTVGGIGYLAGATTLNVASTTGFEKATGYNGALKVTPTTGSVFYLSWSASTATSFTVVGTAIFNTTAVNCAIGDAVEEVSWIKSHPINAALSILLSTGTSGANGTYDVMPMAQGMGLPAEYVAREDSYAWQLRVAPAGSQEWSIWTPGQKDDVFDWISGWLAEGGMFLTLWQGQISVRAVLDPNKTANFTTGIVIDLGKQFEILAYSTRHEDCDVEYDIITRTTTGTPVTSSYSGDDVWTLPAIHTDRADLSFVYQDESSWLTEIFSRIGPWWTRVSESISIRAGLQYWALAPGDIVELVGGTELLLPGGREHTWEGLQNHRAWVQQVSFDGSSVIIDLAILPIED